MKKYNKNMFAKDTKTVSSFGAGSLIFKVHSEKVETLENHISRFVEELRRVPGIENVSIKPDPLCYKEIFPNNGVVNLSFLNLEFEIDLSAGDFCKEGENKFYFVSRMQYDSILTFVFPRFETNNPSDSIYRVREHIKSFINSPYELDVLGPSPFHADFFIEKTNFFNVSLEKTHGYDKVLVYVMSNSDRDIVEELYKNLSYEFDVFYLLRNIDSAHIELWGEVQNLVSRAIGKPSFFSWRFEDQFYFRHNYLGKAIRSLAEFEAHSIYSKQLAERRYSQVYSVNSGYLSFYLNEEIKENYQYPIKTTQNLLTFISDSKNKDREIFHTYVNTFVNVVLGVGVALMLYHFGV